MNTYVPIFQGLQTCNREYTKHCTWSRHQLKMAAPAEVSKRCSNFRIRQFKEKRHYNIAANLTFNTTVSFVTLLIARTARIACACQTYIHTHTQDDYCNPLYACAPRVNNMHANKATDYLIPVLHERHGYTDVVFAPPTAILCKLSLQDNLS